MADGKFDINAFMDNFDKATDLDNKDKVKAMFMSCYEDGKNEKYC